MSLVLVVEDSPLIRMGAVASIVEAGFLTFEAGGADEAIQILEGRPDIQLVFTDVEMPGSMDGIALAQCIWSRWPSIKLIVTSGRTVAEKRDLPPGARFFPKPYDGQAIVEAVIAMLKDPWPG